MGGFKHGLHNADQLVVNTEATSGSLKHVALRPWGSQEHEGKFCHRRLFRCDKWWCFAVSSQ